MQTDFWGLSKNQDSNILKHLGGGGTLKAKYAECFSELTQTWGMMLFSYLNFRETTVMIWDSSKLSCYKICKKMQQS